MAGCNEEGATEHQSPGDVSLELEHGDSLLLLMSVTSKGLSRCSQQRSLVVVIVISLC
jgi:hypothetical protein